MAATEPPYSQEPSRPVYAREPSFTQAVLRVVAIVLASVVAVYLIYVLRKQISWIIVAAFTAVALAAPVSFVQRGVKRRGLAIAIVYLVVILIPVLFAAILVPPLATEGNQLIQQFPTYVDDVERFVSENPRLNQISQDYDLTGQLRQHASSLVSSVGSAAGTLSNIGLGILNSVIALGTILILSIFMMLGGRGWVESFIASRPPQHREPLRRAGAKISKAISGYVVGAVIQGTIAGVSAWFVLWLLGVPYAAALGLIVGVTDLIPMIGATIGGIVVGIVTVFTGFPGDTIVWAIWAIVYQQLENSIIQPRIQAQAVDVQPIIVMISVLFGSTLFGVMGALLAIPFAASVQIVWREVRDYRRNVEQAAAAGRNSDGAPPPDQDGSGGPPGQTATA